MKVDNAAQPISRTLYFWQRDELHQFPGMTAGLNAIAGFELHRKAEARSLRRNSTGHRKGVVLR
jgi:hypothetical protein